MHLPDFPGTCTPLLSTSVEHQLYPLLSISQHLGPGQVRPFFVNGNTHLAPVISPDVVKHPPSEMYYKVLSQTISLQYWVLNPIPYGYGYPLFPAFTYIKDGLLKDAFIFHRYDALTLFCMGDIFDPLAAPLIPPPPNI